MKRAIFIQMKYLYFSKFTLKRVTIELIKIVEIVNKKIASRMLSFIVIDINKAKYIEIIIKNKKFSLVIF
ncbi:hypothetical protein ACFPVY_00930 [Flavobacterium qiangtangense]|uniref:Uncharacterized protein n=1 Tax=Flavobacterium qiangtangense TaxID=1442595 RepID=A0ABW1PJK4_9FLAO